MRQIGVVFGIIYQLTAELFFIRNNFFENYLSIFLFYGRKKWHLFENQYLNYFIDPYVSLQILIILK